VGTIRSYRDLKVWQKAMQLVERCYEISRTCTAGDRYELLHQLRDAAISIPANIAEGHGRGSTGAYRNHLQIALGSLAELETLIELAVRVRLIGSIDAAGIQACSDETGRMLRGLFNALAPAVSLFIRHQSRWQI
jgi:four helix bundle protein